jgi:hypothetical protein
MNKLSSDTNIGTVASDFAFEIDKAFIDACATELGVTEERLHEYKKLLKSLDTRRLDRNKKGTVCFMLRASQASYVVNCLNAFLLEFLMEIEYGNY